MAVDIRLHLTEMAPGQVKECQPGNEAHTHFLPDRHLPSTITVMADQTCTLTDTGIETATVTATEHLLEPDPQLEEVISTPTFQAIVNVKENANANARGTETGIEIDHRAIADIVVDHP